MIYGSYRSACEEPTWPGVAGRSDFIFIAPFEQREIGQIIWKARA